MMRLRRKLCDFDLDYVVDLQNSSRTAMYRQRILPRATWSFIKDAKKATSQLPKFCPAWSENLGN
jgi:ADP-heptose:LPS heptosyltransferase